MKTSKYKIEDRRRLSPEFAYAGFVVVYLNGEYKAHFDTMAEAMEFVNG